MHDISGFELDYNQRLIGAILQNPELVVRSSFLKP